jgi:hypothetical protein
MKQLLRLLVGYEGPKWSCRVDLSRHGIDPCIADVERICLGLLGTNRQYRKERTKMPSVNYRPKPEPKRRGRPVGSRNKRRDVSPHLAMTILHEVANLPQNHDLTPNQVCDEAAREITARLSGSPEKSTLRTSNIARHKALIVRDQTKQDNAYYRALDRLLGDYFERYAGWDEYDPETEPPPASPPPFEAWSAAELATLDHEFPTLPQGVTTGVADANPFFVFEVRDKPLRRRCLLNVSLHN